ncbi:MAG: SDR family oxidoreductase [Phycisphaerales bacterium]|nr:SDR family oxidoreductase [Phycisphaerales bacterium]
MKIIASCLVLAVSAASGSSTDIAGQDAAEPVLEAGAPERAVLITGASTGIGRSTAEYLAKNGFFVYAGARKDKDLAELNKLDNVQGIRLDVTIPGDIEAAVETVTDAGRGLYGLINNAGVLVMAPLTEVTESDLLFQLDVNVMGPYRVTKAFADLLIESKGRVLTTGSIAGFVTWGLGGPYTMSKHAVEAYTDCLAEELEPLGVGVSVIEPGSFRSRIWTSTVDRMKAKGYTAEGSRYEGALRRFMERGGINPEQRAPLPVAKAFHAALTSPKPLRRYMVTPNQNQAESTLMATFRRIAQLNEGHEFTYSREELHEMLDRAIGPE